MTTRRQKFSPSARLRRNAECRDKAMRRPKRPEGLIFHLANSYEHLLLDGLKGRLKWARECKAQGTAYRVRRLGSRLTRSWDDLIQLIKNDIRLRLLAVRNLQSLATARGFRLPG